MRLTHRSALIVAPPQELWEPIQAIRRRYDRQVRRWMPHINLLYPFLPEESFPQVEPRLAAAVSQLSPFELALEGPRVFHHGGGRATVWLEPVPGSALKALYERLRASFPECDHVERFAAGYTPHLSVGQARGGRALQEVLRAVRAMGRPLRFRVDRVHWIARGEPPDDRFRVRLTVALAS